jgi:hypothetical protein
MKALFLNKKKGPAKLMAGPYRFPRRPPGNYVLIMINIWLSNYPAIEIETFNVLIIYFWGP